MLNALTETSVELQLNGRWVIDVEVLDDDSNTVSAAVTVTVTVTSPSGAVTTPTVTRQLDGRYRAIPPVAAAGRWVAKAEATNYGSISFSAYVTSITTAAQFPLLADVKTYLGATSTSDATIQDALDAEAGAQRKKCHVPAIYEADLRQALLRRVARNLALRGVPLAVLQGDTETGNLTPPGRDPEVRRLEAPYYRVVLF